MAHAGELDVLVVREVDRLSRSLAKQLIVEEELKRCDVQIDYVLGDYPDTPEGRLNKHIRATIAEYEREKINERMKRGRLLKVKAGSTMFNGNPPYGYREVQDDDGNWELVIVPEQGQIVELIFTWYVHGDSEAEPSGPMTISAITGTASATFGVSPSTGPFSTTCTETIQISSGSSSIFFDISRLVKRSQSWRLYP